MPLYVFCFKELMGLTKFALQKFTWIWKRFSSRNITSRTPYFLHYTGTLSVVFFVCSVWITRLVNLCTLMHMDPPTPPIHPPIYSYRQYQGPCAVKSLSAIHYVCVCRPPPRDPPRPLSFCQERYILLPVPQIKYSALFCPTEGYSLMDPKSLVPDPFSRRTSSWFRF